MKGEYYLDLAKAEVEFEAGWGGQGYATRAASARAILASSDPELLARIVAAFRRREAVIACYGMTCVGGTATDWVIAAAQ